MKKGIKPHVHLLSALNNHSDKLALCVRLSLFDYKEVVFDLTGFRKANIVIA